MQGRWTVRVAANSPKTAHTRQGRVPRRAMPGMRTVQVAANSPKTAHTRRRQTSAMSPVRYCGGTPHRAVQNQAFCRTGRPRRTVRYRKRPCGVRESFLSAGGRTQRWQQRRSSCRTDDGRKRSRWRIVVAQVRRKPMRARWLQSRCDGSPPRGSTAWPCQGPAAGVCRSAVPEPRARLHCLAVPRPRRGCMPQCRAKASPRGPVVPGAWTGYLNIFWAKLWSDLRQGCHSWSPG